MSLLLILTYLTIIDNIINDKKTVNVLQNFMKNQTFMCNTSKLVLLFFHINKMMLLIYCIR